MEIRWDEMSSDELARAAVVMDVYSNHRVISMIDKSGMGSGDGGESAKEVKEYDQRRAELFSE